MATKPTVKNLDANSVEILNAIRSNASPQYRSVVPVATNEVESIRSIGNVLRNYVSLQNEFLSALFNRIAITIVTSKLWENPLSVFKRGILEVGETIEEIFVNIARPHLFDPEKAESEVWKREIPDVRAAFHYLNYKKNYKSTIQEGELNEAFTSLSGVTDLIAKIVDSMYTGANYDEYIATKYLLAKALVDGRIKTFGVNTSVPSSVVKTVKSVSNDFEFLKSDYNEAGVMNASKKSEQFILINSEFDATMDVDVLASAFNMEKVEFLGKRVLFDGFTFDNARLAELFGSDFTPFTSDELAALANVPIVVVDENYFMIYDYMQKFTELYNGEGMYWNYWLHRWVVFSTSPFANAAAFVNGTPSVSAITVSPSEATVTPGTNTQLTASVTASDFASKLVDWNVSDPGAVITDFGMLEIPVNYLGASTVTVTATSRVKPSVTGNSTITVSSS